MTHGRYDGTPHRGILGLRAESGMFLRLDLVRFIAAVAVVVHHFEVNIGIPHSAAPGLPFFVDVFFVISGIVISYAYGERLGSLRAFASFMKARVARLAPLHWLLTLGYVAINLAAAFVGLSVAEPDRYDPACLPSVLALFHAVSGCERNVYNYVSWSISAEMALYFLFPILLMVSARSKGLLLGMTGAALGLLHVFLPGWWNLTYNGGALRALPGFMIGISLWAYREPIRDLRVSGHLFLPAVVVLLAVMIFVENAAITVHAAYLFVFVVFAADMAGQPNETVTWLAPLGALTYSIYMIHPMANTIFISLLAQRILGLEGAVALLFGWGTVVSLIPIGYLSYRYFETPCRRMIKGL